MSVDIIIYFTAVADAVRTSLGPRGMDKMVFLLTYQFSGVVGLERSPKRNFERYIFIIAITHNECN